MSTTITFSDLCKIIQMLFAIPQIQGSSSCLCSEQILIVHSKKRRRGPMASIYNIPCASSQGAVPTRGSMPSHQADSTPLQSCLVSFLLLLFLQYFFELLTCAVNNSCQRYPAWNRNEGREMSFLENSLQT